MDWSPLWMIGLFLILFTLIFLVVERLRKEQKKIEEFEKFIDDDESKGGDEL